MTHLVVDAGDGTCSVCTNRTATYAGRLVHRRGRRPGAPTVRLSGKVVYKCRSCGRANRPTRLFVLITEVKGAYNVIRRRAGRARLCEPCWRKITTER